MRSLVVLGLLLWTPVAHAAPIWVKGTVTASSVKSGPPASPDKFAPSRAVDHDLESAWCEGATASGIGETLTIKLDAPAKVNSLELIARYGSQVTALDVVLDGGSPRRVKLTKGLGYLPINLTARTIAVTIAEATGGDVCLDVGVHGFDIYVGHDKPFQALAAAVATLMTAMKACDAAALDKIGKFPVSRAQRFLTARTLAEACRRKQVSQLQPEGWPDGSCGFLAADRVACTGTGPDSTWVIAWSDDAWKLVSVTERVYRD